MCLDICCVCGVAPCIPDTCVPRPVTRRIVLQFQVCASCNLCFGRMCAVRLVAAGLIAPLMGNAWTTAAGQPHKIYVTCVCCHVSCPRVCMQQEPTFLPRHVSRVASQIVKHGVVQDSIRDVSILVTFDTVYMHCTPLLTKARSTGSLAMALCEWKWERGHL